MNKNMKNLGDVRNEMCDKVFSIDNNIRFVGLVNKEGEVVGGGFKKGIEPLLNQTEEQDMYVQSLSNMNFFQSFSEKFGQVDYLIIRQKKISIMTFPHRDEILCISTSSESDIDYIRDQTIHLLAESIDFQ